MDTTNMLADAAARKAAERAQAATFPAKVKRFFNDCGSAVAGVCRGAWRGTPSAIRALFLFVIYSVGLGFLGVLTFWELRNAGSGYSLIFAGWGGSLAFWGGVAVAGSYMFSHRQHKETVQLIEELQTSEVHAMHEQNAMKLEDVRRKAKKAREQSRRWMVSTFLCGLVTLFGVFSNLVSHASMDTAAAIEIDEDRAELRRDISRMRRELGVMPKPEGVEFTRETLAAYEAEAVGWKMTDLKPDGACLADLKKRQRDLCNLAAEIRAELIEADEMQAAVDLKTLEIETAEDRLEDMQPVAGAKHYEKMAELVMSIPGVPAEWNKSGVANSIQVWGVLILAIVGLYICAVGWHFVGEKIQEAQKPKALAIEKV